MRNVRTLLCCALLLSVMPLPAATFTTNGPSTTNNDDSCDIAVLPAATLLLPYFEVDLGVAGGQTTIFTVTNVTNLPQAASVTLWTDRGYPVITFPIYLTGYDVQSINIYDVIRRGQLAPDAGTGSDVSPVGELSGDTVNQVDNDNPQLNEATCVRLPVLLPNIYVQRMQQAFTTGKVPQLGTIPACNNVGGTHQNAVGYATIDVVGACTASTPIDLRYFSDDIRYDNVLVGDYLQIDGTNDFAQGSPLVHLRAVPEGGSGSARRNTNLRRTFYSHLQPANTRTSDARQPLPSTFAARWIDGGSGDFRTFFKIWREVDTAAGATCEQYTANAAMPIAEVVRFDEEENPEASYGDVLIPSPVPSEPSLPAASLLSVANETVIPLNTGSDVGGWIYFNLHNERPGNIASQNWVVVSMRSEDRFSVDMDALSLGNGCSPVTAVSNANIKNNPAPAIGPAANVTP
jgi:hypothetical protein